MRWGFPIPTTPDFLVPGSPGLQFCSTTTEYYVFQYFQSPTFLSVIFIFLFRLFGYFVLDPLVKGEGGWLDLFADTQAATASVCG
jgi:hypothetical protein